MATRPRPRARDAALDGSPPATPDSAWGPLRHRTFRALWTAQFASNIGTWMQTVAAQWLMVSLSASALDVALVQTATSLPVLLVGLPAGALGDILDRRRLLLATQTFMLASAAVLGGLTLAGTITPALLLGLTFAVGLGRGLTTPSWQAIQPELVAREEIPQAAALGGVNVNLARAVGPAAGGFVVALAGAGAAFLVNAASFLGVIGVLGAWRERRAAQALGAEHVGSAMRAGVRYVRSSPRMRAVLVRAGLFVVFSSALWALLPVVAHRRLGLGSGGYGLLLASVGVGAVLGATLLPRLRARWSVNAVVAGSSAVYAAACLVLAWVPVAAVVAVGLVAAGVGWIGVLASINGTAQTVLPGWVRSRGMALYLLVFQGGQAIGSLVWGLVAERLGTPVALTIVAAGLAAGLATVGRFRLRSGETLDQRPSVHWPEPQLVTDPDPAHGPVLVTLEYRVPEESAEEFRAVMERIGRSRRRSGAQRWHLFQDGADPTRFLEIYVVATWEEHLRQHGERLTVTDQRFEERARALAEPGSPRVSHLLSAYARRGAGVRLVGRWRS